MLGDRGEKGILDLAAEEIFTYVSNHPERDFLIRVSFVEIYNEEVRDLISDAADTTVTIREDPMKGVYNSAVEVMLNDYASLQKVVKKGVSKRATAQTNMNDTSSRSHTVFQ